jgi:hypothetical protein
VAIAIKDAALRVRLLYRQAREVGWIDQALTGLTLANSYVILTAAWPIGCTASTITGTPGTTPATRTPGRCLSNTAFR